MLLRLRYWMLVPDARRHHLDDFRLALHAHLRHLEPALRHRVQLREVLAIEELQVMHPALVRRADRVMDDMDVIAHAEAEAREVRAEREIHVVHVPAVERLLVKAMLFQDGASAGDEEAVESLDSI